MNRERSGFEQIKRFLVLPREFDAAEDEVTPTLKLRRKVILEHFADEIDALYEAPSEPALEDPPGPDVRVLVRGERGDLNVGAGVRRLHELAAADVHPDVAEPVEEEDVARLRADPRRPERRDPRGRTRSAAARSRAGRTSRR